MKLYRKGAHTVFDLKYHIVWTVKYKKPVLEGKIGIRTRDLIREVCATENIQIIRGHVSKDHVHLFISMPPQISVSKIVQYMKGKTSRKILQEFPRLHRQFWGKHFWSRGYFVTTSGAITDEMVADYIKNQDEDEDKRGDNFTTLDLS
jgi:putative transposase